MKIVDLLEVKKVAKMNAVDLKDYYNIFKDIESVLDNNYSFIGTHIYHVKTGHRLMELNITFIKDSPVCECAFGNLFSPHRKLITIKTIDEMRRFLIKLPQLLSYVVSINETGTAYLDNIFSYFKNSKEWREVTSSSFKHLEGLALVNQLDSQISVSDVITHNLLLIRIKIDDGKFKILTHVDDFENDGLVERREFSIQEIEKVKSVIDNFLEGKYDKTR
jgi:hypothetical protein